MLVVRAAQMKILNLPWQEQFRSKLVAYLSAEFPVETAALGADGVEAMIEAGIRKAQGLGIDQEADVCDLIALVVEHGTGFEQLPWAAPIVGSSEGWDVKLGQLVGWAEALRLAARRV